MYFCILIFVHCLLWPHLSRFHECLMIPRRGNFLIFEKTGKYDFLQSETDTTCILCKSEKCQCECLWHLQIQILCWFGLNIRNKPILEKRLLISSICNFHHYLEAGANFGTFCNLIDHCSPPYFLLETLCCKTFFLLFHRIPIWGMLSNSFFEINLTEEKINLTPNAEFGKHSTICFHKRCSFHQNNFFAKSSSV